MAKNSRWIAVVVLGAIGGAVTGYLFFTDEGRTLRRQVERALEDVARELSSFRMTMQQAANVADEGRKYYTRRFPSGAGSAPGIQASVGAPPSGKGVQEGSHPATGSLATASPHGLR